MRHIKSIFTWISISLVSVTANAQLAPSGDIVDKIVAQVGDNIVLHSDVETQLAQARAQQAPITQGTRCYILEEMLYQNLLLNQAKLDSVNIPDAQVNGEMEQRLRTIEAQIGSKEKLEAFYGKTYTQIKEEFRPIIRDRLMAQEMERQITSDISVTPRDVQKFYNSIPKDSLPFVNSKIAIQQIAIYPKVTEEDRADIVKQLNGYRKSIINGDRQFSTMARLYSEDPGSSKEGGKIVASRGMMVKPFEAAAFSLEIGGISEVFESEYGFHFLQLLERKGDDYVCRHILMSPKISDKSYSEASLIIEECYNRLEKKEITWEQAVKLYSEDEETKQNKGNLSNPYTGEQFWDVAQLNEIDPQIFALTDGMEVGDFSAPGFFESSRSRKQGLRILRLKDRTEPHVANMKEDYTFIKSAAENDMKSKVITDWVNAKLKLAYIKIDDNYKNCEYRYNWF